MYFTINIYSCHLLLTYNYILGVRPVYKNYSYKNGLTLTIYSDSKKKESRFLLTGFIKHVFGYIKKLYVDNLKNKMVATVSNCGITFFKRTFTDDGDSRNSY